MTKAKQDRSGQAKPDAPAADSILDKLLRAADLRADYLLSCAEGGSFVDADSIELTTLMGSIARVADMDLRWLEKHDPRFMQELLSERVQAGQKGEHDSDD